MVIFKQANILQLPHHMSVTVVTPLTSMREKEYSENICKPYVENMNLGLYSLILPLTERWAHC